MKKLIYLFALLIVSASCNKKDNTVTPTPPPVTVTPTTSDLVGTWHLKKEHLKAVHTSFDTTYIAFPNNPYITFKDTPFPEYEVYVADAKRCTDKAGVTVATGSGEGRGISIIESGWNYSETDSLLIFTGVNYKVVRIDATHLTIASMVNGASLDTLFFEK